ncbi:hypothetical protein P4S63_19305 [Pseudoalteromonas sp. B193]
MILGYLVNFLKITATGYINSVETSFLTSISLFSVIIELLNSNVKNEQQLVDELNALQQSNSLSMPNWSEIIEEEVFEDEGDEEQENTNSVSSSSSDFYALLLNWIVVTKQRW